MLQNLRRVSAKMLKQWASGKLIIRLTDFYISRPVHALGMIHLLESLAVVQ
jgi:hypothetical protein